MLLTEMDLINITSAISSVGFPIVMCITMMWYVRELNTSHKEESKYMTQAINKNTMVIQKLCEKLNVKDEELEI